jgi:hypothetical protein
VKIDAPRTGLPDPTLTAERLLSKLGAKEPPVNLGDVASLWPNLFLTEADLDGAGYLLPIGELGAEILINKTDAEERKRFTLAHELGHWVLGITLKKKFGHFSQPKDSHRAEIERWCDKFATNLLMPAFMIKASIPLNEPTVVVESLVRAATKFSVSESAFFIRIWEVLRVQVSVVAVKGVHGRYDTRLEKGYGDEQTEMALKQLLRLSHFIDGIMSSPTIYMSSSSGEKKVECFGRRISPERVLLAIKWP